jgi:pilus assembly protein CpaB
VNRRIVGISAAVLLAVFGTFVIVAYVRGADNRAMEGKKTVNVLVVQKTVPAGTPASQLGDSVKAQRVVKDDVAQGAVASAEDLNGLVTGATLVPGEQVVRARFVDASSYQASGGNVEVPKGLLQTTVALDPERAVGGLINPGMHVAVSATFDDKNGVPAQTHMILHQVLVTNVQVTQSSDKSSSSSSNDASTTATKPGDAPAGRLLVTLALDAPSVERVVFAAEQGSLWLSSEPTGAPTIGTKNIDRANVLS